MATQIFSSFEAFFAANQHSNLRGMVLGRQHEDWVLTHLIVNNLSVQWGRAGASVIVEGGARAGGVSIFVPTQGWTGVSGNGHQFDESSLMVNVPGAEFCIANDASRRWFSVYVPSETLAGASGDAMIRPVSTHGFVQLPTFRIERFRSLIGQFDEAVQQAPDAFASADAQKAAEQKLVYEIRNLLGVLHRVEHSHGRHVLPRGEILRTCMEFVERHDGEFLSVEQLATAAGVSERTLREVFQRYYGLAPVQYLNRRTLHQVRKALKTADPTVATVTEIATQFGVWQFGRLARDYRFLFGELPSKTLRRAA
jgi:AraC family transcriptional regulator, ethanolamine operon transcriptional activator